MLVVHVLVPMAVLVTAVIDNGLNPGLVCEVNNCDKFAKYELAPVVWIRFHLQN